jgi:hypothetical protein
LSNNYDVYGDTISNLTGVQVGKTIYFYPPEVINGIGTLEEQG